MDTLIDKQSLQKKNELLSEDRQGEVFAAVDHSHEIDGKQYYIESYGCQMNFNDSEIVASILGNEGYTHTKSLESADLILINTCSIREKAEQTVRRRLKYFESNKKKSAYVGVLGCMAERLKSKLLEEEKLVDLVVGPDAYRDIPKLIVDVDEGEKGINVFLSKEETYADIAPQRLDSNGVTAFISIMRGCDNMCSFCVVPFTRGRERSRNAFTIVSEIENLFHEGYREVTLLGQNVDSYKWINPETNETVNFAGLLRLSARVHPLMRIRFSTSHPKDMTDEVLYVMASFDNICKYIHLPVQSGNSRILDLMNRTYTREWYINRLNAIYSIIPDCAISSDIIAGFCTETEKEHQETLSLMDLANYSMSYMFVYSERPGTLAARKLEDDVDHNIKKRRLQEIISLQNKLSLNHNKNDIGKSFKVLIEGNSKKSDNYFKGRNSQNKMIVFPKIKDYQPGQYIDVKVHDATSATLIGEAIHS